jgi:hypothetical protein
MAFEKFLYSGKTFKPRIAIRQNGQIGFNKGAEKRFELNKYEYIILYYDKEEQKIGIQLTNEENIKGVMKLQKRPLNIAISAKSFFEYYNISYSETKIYDPEWDEKNKMIIIKLKSTEGQQYGG